MATGSAGKDQERVAAVAEVRKALGAQLRRLREGYGATVEAVGVALGVKRQTVSGWELGEGEPNEADVLKLAALYGITPAEVRYGPALPSGPLEMYDAGRREMGEWIGEMIQAALAGPHVVATKADTPIEPATRAELKVAEDAARAVQRGSPRPKRRGAGGSGPS